MKGYYKYCKDIYLMEENMVDEFLEMSNIPICDNESAVKYMEFAMKYWDMKEKELSKYGIFEK